MMKNFVIRKGFSLFLLAASWMPLAGVAADGPPTPEFRPQYHFTPKMNWMNDPNGLLYENGRFQMFFQYNPLGSVADNQSWGHAVGVDLLHWAQLPLAIPYVRNAQGVPTDLIFSGSAVADVGNTSGFGRGGRVPLVAIYADNYTVDQVLPNGVPIRAGTQAQSLAYSLDDGLTWTQYAGNPVIVSPPAPYSDQFQAFRDPKVFWYAPERKWVMAAVLSNVKKVVLYSSKNLKNWTYMSSFGPFNAVFGAWECPDLFPLRVDGVGPTKWVMMIGINPGGYTAGSADQYFVGQFDGTRFIADSDSVYDISVPGGSVPVLDLGAVSSYAQAGWGTSGAFVGAGPVGETLDGSSASRFIDTFLGGDSAKGILTSPVFTISHSYVNFQIGGGYHPYDPLTWHGAADTETAINLLVDGKVVASTTGNGLGAVSWRSWDVRGLMGRQAQIEIVDANTGDTGWGHLFVGNLVFSDQTKQEANWVDYGPDFYAAVTWNGLPDSYRVAIGWMNNWNYGQQIPTSPWRGQYSIPRRFGLRTLEGAVRLVQAPVDDLPILYGKPFRVARSDDDVVGVSRPVVGNAFGDALHAWMDFVPRTAEQFGILLRVGANGEQTRVGYDMRTASLFIDRERSGQVGFNAGFAGVYTAPLRPDADGHVRFRVLLDRSSVEVFGGVGQSVLSAQIFPSAASQGVAAFATGGDAVLHAVQVMPMVGAR